MNDNGSNKNGNDRKSLMDVLVALENTAIKLTDLLIYSDEIMNIVSSPRGKRLPTPDEEKVVPTDEGKDIVYLFGDVNESIGESIIRIRNNFEELKLMIG